MVAALIVLVHCVLRAISDELHAVPIFDAMRSLMWDKVDKDQKSICALVGHCQ